MSGVNGVKDFIHNLLQASQWTEKLAEGFDYEHGCYATVFRHTNPIINGRMLYNIDREYVTWNVPDSDISTFHTALQLACTLRTPLSSEDKSYHKELIAKGRILCFELLATTHDTIAIGESKGFMDESDVPPLDTWFAINNRTLFCFIPTKFVAIVKAAMRIQIIRCYDWLEEAEPALARTLKSHLH